MDILIAWLSFKDINKFNDIASEPSREIVNSIPPALLTSTPALEKIIDYKPWDKVFLIVPCKLSIREEFQAFFSPIVEIKELELNENLYKGLSSIEIQKIINNLIKKKRDNFYLLDPMDSVSQISMHLKCCTNNKIKLCQIQEEHDGNIKLSVSSEDGIQQIIEKSADIFKDIVGNTAIKQKINNFITKSSRLSSPVLIEGENGTGKKMIAHKISEFNSRKLYHFYFPADHIQMDEELFGAKDIVSAFKEADNGIILLENINQCHLKTQVRILEVLRNSQEEQYTFFNRESQTKETVDIKIIATSNQPLIEAVKEGKFIEELYYRLANLIIKLPPLRLRKDDIPVLAWHFLRKISLNKYFTQTANKLLNTYDWPGNIRELEQVIKISTTLTDSNIIHTEDICISSGYNLIPKKEKSQMLSPGFTLENEIIKLKKYYVKEALKYCGGVKTQATQILGIKNYQTLTKMLKDFDIDQY